MKKRFQWIVLLVLVCISSQAFSQKTFDERIGWYRDAKFGMFIHWGTYSNLAGYWKGESCTTHKPKYAEWIQASMNIPKSEYSKAAHGFQPTKFDADAWVKTAKDAGMKYLVITTKHHEGFCLWDSEYTDYDVKDWNGLTVDYLGEISKACKKYGIVFGTYYSIIDWYHPSQKPKTPYKNGWSSWGQTEFVNGEKSKKEYIQYMKNQLKELAEKYDTKIFWFDGDWVKWWNMQDGQDLYDYLLSIQPDAIINNRVAKRNSFYKDFGTPENFTPGAKLDYDWESCYTMNHSWGFKKDDHGWKEPKKLVQELIDINSKGGNYLLNVGPTGDGIIPEASVAHLKAMGEWLSKNGASIYETEFSNAPLQEWGRVTQKENTYYLNVFDFPKNGTLEFYGITGDIKEVKVLETGKILTTTLAKESTMIDVTGVQPNEFSTAIAVTFKPNTIQLHDKASNFETKEGDVVLYAADAKTKGTGKKGKGGPRFNFREKAISGLNTGTASWRYEMVVPGTYEVIYVCNEFNSELTIQVNDQSKEIRIAKGTEKTRLISGGKVKFANIDNYEFVISGKSTDKTKEGVAKKKKGKKKKKTPVQGFKLQAVILRPVK